MYDTAIFPVVDIMFGFGLIKTGSVAMAAAAADDRREYNVYEVEHQPLVCNFNCEVSKFPN